MKIFISIVFLFISGMSVHAQEKTPDWVEGASEQYKPSEYVIGVGSGETKKEAKKKAQEAISKVFDQNHTATPIDTQQILKGTEIKKIWKDPKGRYYAFAALQKIKIMLRLREQVTILDRKLDQFLRRVDEEKLKSHDRLQLYLEIVPLARMRRAYVQLLQSLSKGEDVEIPTDYGYEEIEQTLDRLLHEVSVQVTIDGEGSEVIRDALVAGLQQEHLHVMESPDKSKDLFIRGHVTTEASISEVQIEIVDQMKKKLVGKIEMSVSKDTKDLVDAVNQKILDYLKKDN